MARVVRAVRHGPLGQEPHHEHFYIFDHETKQWLFHSCSLPEGARCIAPRGPRPSTGIPFGRRLLPREEAELEKEITHDRTG